MRLIDADMVLTEMENTFDMQGLYLPTHFMEFVIDEMPTVDPVKHGRWIFSQDHAEGICTVCNYKIYGRPYNNTYMIVPYNYCPRCGAKMDEVE